jgi:hypothetical protein
MDRGQLARVKQAAVSSAAGATNALAHAQVLESVVSSGMPKVANLPYASATQRASFFPFRIDRHALAALITWSGVQLAYDFRYRGNSHHQ